MKTLSAIDIGYNLVKCMATNGRQAHFPAVVGTEHKATFSLAEAKRPGLVITLPDGPIWHVGQTALLESDYSAGRRDPEWLFSPTYHVLLCAALSELHKATTTTSVVTGLPLEHYNALVDRAQEVFVGEHTFKRSEGTWQTVTIENVMVVTQPYGSLLDMALTDTGQDRRNVFSTDMVAIADVGGRTLNLLVTDGLREIARWTKGDDMGLLKALDDIAADIHNDHPGLSPRTHEVAQWVARGHFPCRGEEVEIAPYLKPRLEPLVQKVLDRISEVWSEPERYAALLLTGGGSVVLGPALKSRLDGVYANVTIAQDPLYANVQGYLKLARYLRLHDKPGW